MTSAWPSPEQRVPSHLLSSICKSQSLHGSHQVRHISTSSRYCILSTSRTRARSLTGWSNGLPLREVFVASKSSGPLIRYKESAKSFRTIPTSDPANLPSFATTTWQETRWPLSKRHSHRSSWPAKPPTTTAKNFTPFSYSIHSTAPLATTSTVPNSLPNTTSSSNSQPGLSHLNSRGEAHMVSISRKHPTHRTATATSLLIFSNPATHPNLSSASITKGDALACARIAGIQAAKQTSSLIPLAHPGLGLTGVSVNIELFSPRPQETNQHVLENYPCGCALITATVSCLAPTGVEMEALIAATIAGLTLYDMCKAIDKGMVLSQTRVIEKKGGKSGDWRYDRDLDRIVPTPPETKYVTVDQKSSHTGTRAQKKTGHQTDPNEALLASTINAQHRAVREDAIRERIRQLDEEVEAGFRNISPVYTTLDRGTLAKHHARRAEAWEKTQGGTIIVQNKTSGESEGLVQELDIHKEFRP